MKNKIKPNPPEFPTKKKNGKSGKSTGGSSSFQKPSSRPAKR